jgi:tubulin-specific chaperone C
VSTHVHWLIREFRIHDSRNMRVYLSCSSRPIIENSQGIGFAGIPKVIRDTIGMYEGGREEWLEKELVEDFNWLRRDHSPNWRLMTETIGESNWSEVLSMVREGSSTNQIMDLVLK